MQNFYPIVPDRHRKRFAEHQCEHAFHFLLIASVLLAVCFLCEAVSQLDVIRRRFFWIPVIFSLLSGVFAWLTYTRRLSRERVMTWQLVLGLLPFALTVMHIEKTTVANTVGFLMLELLGLCIFMACSWRCLFGALIIGGTMVSVLLVEGSTSLIEIATFLLPSFTLVAVAHVARQRSQRTAFLRGLEKETINHELVLAKLALDNTSQFVLRMNEDGLIEYVNESLCNALGCSNDRLIGMPIFDIARNWTAGQFATVRNLLKNQKTNPFEMRLAVEDREIVVEMQLDYLSYQSESDEERATICGVAFDLSQRLRVEQEMLRMQRLEGLETIAGGVAHDFNNLLQPIMTNAALAIDFLPTEDPAYPRVQRILTASERAADLTQELLVYTGKSGLQAKPISLPDEVRAVANLIESSLPKGTQLAIQEEVDVPLVMAESAQMHRVFLNLIQNAGQAVRGDCHGDRKEIGRVDVKLGVRDFSSDAASRLEPAMPRAAGAYVTCEVTDNGCGMSADTRRRMFDPFFTSKPDGQGLGLSAVMGMIKNHKGGISVRSEVERGTSIEICLPALSTTNLGHVESAKTQQSSIAKPTTNVEQVSFVEQEGSQERNESFQDSQPVILVADDEELVRLAAVEVLQPQGFRVLLASTGDEAVELCRKLGSHVELVILDNRMPGRGTLRTIEAIRDSSTSIEIILSSGFPIELPTELTEGSAKIPLLPKPYSPEKLLGTVAATLARRVA